MIFKTIEERIVGNPRNVEVRRMRCVEGRQQPRAEAINRASQGCRVLREPVQQKQISRERENGHMILRLKRAQKLQHLLAREGLIFEISVKRVEKNDDGRARVLSFQVGAIGKYVRWQRTSRRRSGSICGKESNLLRSAIIQQREIRFLQARNRCAAFVLHYYIHLHKPRRGANYLRPLSVPA